MNYNKYEQKNTHVNVLNKKNIYFCQNFGYKKLRKLNIKHLTKKFRKILIFSLTYHNILDVPDTFQKIGRIQDGEFAYR